MTTRRPDIIEVPLQDTLRATATNGDRAVCGEVGGPACMCQPSEHGGKGACGKKIASIIVGS